MDFQSNTVIADQRGEQRWKIVSLLEQLPNLKIWEVADQAPGMERTLRFMALDYAQLSASDRDFSIRQLRDGFHRMVKTLGAGSYNFLPEPVDFITFSNHFDPMDAELRASELGLVYAQSEGMKLQPLRNKQGQLEIEKLRKLVNAALKVLTRLHNQKIVIQALPRTQIRLNLVTYQPYFTGIQTLMPMDDFNGFNPNRASLSPSIIFSAPESFAPRGRLTPATDIYAVGKLALQLLLGDNYTRHFTPQAPFPDDTQTLINALNLPEPWPRFLSICLQLDPAQRFQNVHEAEIFLLPKDKQEAIEKQRAKVKAQQTQAARPPAKPTATAASQKKEVYRKNPQLPDAMLLIWGERLTTKEQRLHFGKLYGDFQNTYNLNPRLFFQTHHTSAISDNPFFTMLQTQYKLAVTPLVAKQDPIGILNHTLDPHLAKIRNLILVGGADEAGVQCILQHPNAGNWRIHWVRGAGSWNPSIRVESVIDMAKYLWVKKP